VNANNRAVAYSTENCPLNLPVRVLLLEDTTFHAELIEAMLTANDIPCSIVRVERREEFLTALQGQSFDVILADYMLPDFDGLTALRLAREQVPDVPVIIVSGVLGEESAIDALKDGAVDYVLKTTLSRLAPAVRRALREAEERKARRQAETALREGEERYRNLFENAIDGIVVGALDGTILMVNREVERLLGFTRAEMIGRSGREFILPPFDVVVREQIRRVLAGGESGLAEVEVLRKDGSVLAVEVRSCVVQDNQRGSSTTQIFFRDISERKAIERQRDDFLAMLTHDIRNPITIILGYTEMLLDEARRRMSSDDVDMLQRLRSNALSLHSLVTNYLDFSRIEAKTSEIAAAPVVLHEVLRRVGDQYEPDASRHGIDLHFALHEGEPRVIGAAIALERVFANIVTNAIKFTPSGGSITIRSEPQENEVQITIADTGPGIPVEDRATIFEKYHTGSKHGEREGTGLGLFIVKSLVETHGGRVTINCPVSGGTEIIVSLPVLHD
jgi:PAS domain S-box-containing protein